MTTKHYSNDKDVNAAVANLVRGGWTVQAKGRSKHPKLIAPNGYRMAFPLTPSDWRALRNLRRDADRLAALPAVAAKRL
ncbi:hypothetical protein BTH42_00505 [Burkholderia sp. SRS-W-2-2016]|uniref:hypothetical protein n=1 Tax=Burkholderia sp. SRS-W-2-2016 TaxID=1926878 RepID=UPI00094B4970|nr:hypothetical protein [Burkholderia sp. SRS-W-2-2016]OLL33691.1 hypothetical protein BTH42_00505 [Burkholderia sp. SRS-W-2-2016]